MRSAPSIFFLALACSGGAGRDKDSAGDDTGPTQTTDRYPTTDSNTTREPPEVPNLQTTGSSEMCVVLFGGNDRVEGPDEGQTEQGVEIPPLPFGTEPRTMQAWVRTNATKAQVAVSYGRSSVGQGFQLGTESGFPFIRTGWSASLAVTGNRYLADDEWHHLAAAWDGTTAFVMVDGDIVGTGALPGSTLEGDVVVGNTPPGDLSKSWVGWVDDVKVLSLARQPAAMAGDLDAETVDPADVMLWWDFEVPEGSMGPGVDVEDLSGNLHHGISAGVDTPQFVPCR